MNKEIEAIQEKIDQSFDKLQWDYKDDSFQAFKEELEKAQNEANKMPRFGALWDLKAKIKAHAERIFREHGFSEHEYLPVIEKCLDKPYNEELHHGILLLGYLCKQVIKGEIKPDPSFN